MEVVLVGPAPPWGGGIASFTGALARSLAAHGPSRWISWRVPRVLLPTTCLASPPDVSASAEALLGIYDPRSWRAVGGVVRGARALVLTVSHPIMYLPYRELVHAYRKAGGAVVLVCHNVVAHEPFAGQRGLARRLLRLADAVVVHSQADAEIVRSLLGVDLRIVEGFHPAYDAHGSQAWPGFPRAQRLLAFGHVRRYKGLPDLLAALVRLPDASLDVVGRIDGSRRALERLIGRLGVGGRVRLDDRYVPEHGLRSVFAQADAVVAPYRQASQSGAVHLAYAFGRPVVATRVGGLVDAVVDGSTGILVAPRDPGALAAGIGRVLDTPPEAFAAGIRAVQKARSWDRYANLVVEAAV